MRPIAIKLWLLFLAGLSVSSTTMAAHANQRDTIAQSIVKVVVVANPPGFAAPWQRTGPETRSGSGVLVPGRRVLTNAHVIADHVVVEVQRGGVGKRFAANVEYICDACDLALLSVNDEQFFENAKPLQIGELPRPQDPINVYGFPEGGERLSVTEGVVSRVEVNYYSHSWVQMLMAQVDAAINPGNSGGPVLSDGKVVGVSTQSRRDAENIAYIVPAPIIRHFLEDVSDGHFDGFPELGVHIQTLENTALRQSLGLSSEAGGVLVAAVSQTGSANGVIKPGDVLLAINGVPVLEDNNVVFGNGLQVNSIFVEHSSQVGERVTVTLFREGTKSTKAVTMLAPDRGVRLGYFDRNPSYRIFGGLVFQPLTLRYLLVFDEIPEYLFSHWSDPTLSGHAVVGPKRGEGNRRQVVVLTGILANELTRGYEQFEDEVIYSVNGEPLKDLSHLSQLLDNASGEFVSFTTERSGVVTMNRQEAEQLTATILRRYQVALDRSPDLVMPASLGN